MCGAGTAARYVSDLRSGAIGCWVGSPQILHVLVATLFIAQIYNIDHLLLKSFTKFERKLILLSAGTKKHS